MQHLELIATLLLVLLGFISEFTEKLWLRSCPPESTNKAAYGKDNILHVHEGKCCDSTVKCAVPHVCLRARVARAAIALGTTFRVACLWRPRAQPIVNPEHSNGPLKLAAVHRDGF